MKKLSGAIFDVDGTLLDSMPIWNDLGASYVRSLGLEPKPNLRETLWSMRMDEAAIFLQEEYGIALSMQEILAGIDGIIEDFYTHEAPLKPGIGELLEMLAQAGIPMSVATATDRSLVEAALSREGILGYFSHVFTCGEVGKGKTSPLIYDMARHSLGTRKKDTLVFEDALYAIRTAKRAGYVVAAVRDASEERQQSVRALADFYFEDLTRIGPLKELLP